MRTSDISLYSAVLIFILQIVLVLGQNGSNLPSHHWGYKSVVDEIPPTDWQKDFPSCKGKYQSPIAIETASTTENPYLTQLEFALYGAHPQNDTWVVINNGHAVQFSGVFGSKLPTVQAGGLPASYVFTQFHFHWGSTDSRGSEHSIDSKRYPLELHIVHRKVTDDDSQALTESTGMAVVGILFELTDDKDLAHQHLDAVIQAIQLTTEPNVPKNVRMPSLSLAEFLPSSPAFYRYQGSLTTPPCAEAVDWSVMRQPQKVTEAQLNVFRRLHERNIGNLTIPEDDLVDNFRPVQSLNGRVISYYSGQTANPNGGFATMPPKISKSPAAKCNGVQSLTAVSLVILAASEDKGEKFKDPAVTKKDDSGIKRSYELGRLDQSTHLGSFRPHPGSRQSDQTSHHIEVEYHSTMVSLTNLEYNYRPNQQADQKDEREQKISETKDSQWCPKLIPS